MTGETATRGHDDRVSWRFGTLCCFVVEKGLRTKSALQIVARLVESISNVQGDPAWHSGLSKEYVVRFFLAIMT